MSIESLILLTIQLSKQPSESKHDLLPQFSIALEGKFDTLETPFKVVYFYSFVSGVVWVKGISVAEQLVSKDLILPDSVVVHFEFPRSQPSNLIEVVPKKKQNATIDIVKFDEIFNLITPPFEDVVFMQKSESRIVIRFITSEVAVKACSIILDKLRDQDYNEVVIRYIQIKEFILYRANFLGFQSYRKTAKSHKEKRNQSLTAFVHYKLNNFLDKPIILEMVCPTYFQQEHNLENISRKFDKQNKSFTVNEEVYLVCMTHTDYRLLKIWEPINLPYNGILIFQKENIENLMCKGIMEPVLPTINIPKVSITPSNPTHKPDITITTTSTTTTTTINAFIFWDYGSCQLDDKLSDSENFDNKLIANVSKNLHKVISNYIKNAFTNKDKPLHSTNTVVAPFTRILFVPHGSWFVTKKPLPKVWNNFSANDYKVHHYSRKNTVDIVMRTQIEEFLKLKKENHTSIYCFVTDDSDYITSLVTMLRLESIQDILLISNPESILEHSNSLSLVKKVYSWSEVQYNRISSAEVDLKNISKYNDSILMTTSKDKDIKLTENIIKTKNKAIPDVNRNTNITNKNKDTVEDNMDRRKVMLDTNKVSSTDTSKVSSISTNKVSSSTNTNNEIHEEELYAKKDLVPWFDPNQGGDSMNDFDIEHDYADDHSSDLHSSIGFDDHISSSIEGKNHKDDDGRSMSELETKGKYFIYKLDLKYAAVATYMRNLFKWYRTYQEEQHNKLGKKQSIVYYNYLFGEDTSGYDEDISSICNIQVETHTRTKAFMLFVRGMNPDMVRLRGFRINLMLEEIFKYRRLHVLSNDWNSEHRLAIVSTDLLTYEEKNMKACAMFHFNQSKIIVEIISLTSMQHQAMLKYIQRLKPKEAMIDISSKCIREYNEAKWDKIRSCFAFKAMVIPGKPADSTTTKLHCFGFLPKLYNQAIDYIKRNDSSIELCVPTSLSTIDRISGCNIQYQHDPDTTNESIESMKSKITNNLTIPQSSNSIINNKEETSKDHITTSILKDNIYSISYIFSDREAGIFFFKFEEEFTSFIQNQYDVMVDEQDRINVRSEINKMEQSNVSNPNLSLYKITLHGSNQKNVQAARAYMDQFNANILTRIKIFFPRMTIKKHKEICSIISQQLTKLANTRLKSSLPKSTSITSDYHKLVLDPLQSKGFINIRSKPEIFGKFQVKVNLPTDVTITLCGPQYPKENKDILDQVENVFNSIPSDYIVCVLSIPSNHYMRHQLSVKKDREELIQKFNLVSIRWEESSKSQGNIGIARIWAFSRNNLNMILKEILVKDKGGIATIISDESHGSLDVLMNESTANLIASTSGGGGGTALTGSSSQLIPRLRDDKDNKTITTSTNSAYHITTNDINHSMIDISKPLLTSKSIIVHIPDLSLRYILQGDPLKMKLDTILDRIRNNGITVIYPYHLRSEPHAIIELSGGDIEKMNEGSLELNDFIDKAAISLRSIHIILSNEQYALLTGGGEGISTNTNNLVNTIQSDFGVHLIFNPPQSTVHESQTLFDLRFSSDVMMKENGLNDVLMNKSSPPTTSISNIEFSNKLSLTSSSSSSTSNPIISPTTTSASITQSMVGVVDQEMISVQVFNCYSRKTVDIAIISSNSSDIGWTWGVNNLLVLVGSNDLGYNPKEIQQLNRGDVLVHSDPQTGKTILRMRPNARFANGINLQAGILTNALLKCLQKANELSLHGMAISAPTDIDIFPDLSPELIRSLTVEAVVEFAKKCRAYLRFTRLVCIELGYNQTTIKQIQKTNEKNNIVSATITALEKQIEPAYKDRMAHTLILLLERQEAELIDFMLQNSYNPSSTMLRENELLRSKLTLLVCNVPLPSTFYTASLTYARNKGCKTLLVRGLLSTIVKTLNNIKVRLQSTPSSHIYEVGFL